MQKDKIHIIECDYFVYISFASSKAFLKSDRSKKYYLML